jgi:hypothetical protein
MGAFCTKYESCLCNTLETCIIYEKYIVYVFHKFSCKAVVTYFKSVTLHKVWFAKLYMLDVHADKYLLLFCTCTVEDPFIRES